MKYKWIFLFIASYTLNSQTNSKDTIPEISLNEIIISANKSEQALRNVAQQVIVINRKHIENENSISTADCIASSGVATIQKSQLGGGSVTIRGFEANRNLLVVDGIRMNNLIYRAGHLQNINTVDQNMLERIEILTGPSSTMYGSDALGGVVHLITISPQLNNKEKGLSVDLNGFLRYSTAASEQSGFAKLNISTDRWAALTAISSTKLGDLVGGKNKNPFYDTLYGERPFYVKRINGKDSMIANSDRYKQIQSGYTQYDFLQKIVFQPTNRTKHLLNIQYSTTSNVPRYDRLTDQTGGELRFAEWYYGPEKRLLLAYEFQHLLESPVASNVKVGINHQIIQESRHQRRFNNVNKAHRIEDVQVTGIFAHFLKKSGNHTFFYGLDAQNHHLKSGAYSENITTGVKGPQDTRYPDGPNRMFQGSVYLSHQLSWNSQWKLVDGIRLGYSALHSEFKDTTFFQFPFSEVDQKNLTYAGNLGIIYTPKDNWKFSALISTGFRVPNVDDLSKVFESTPGSLIVPNSTLKPEKTLTGELGITYIHSNRLKWENAFYYTRFIDAIVTDAFTLNGEDSVLYEGNLSRVLANQNKRKAFIYGISSNLHYRIRTDLSFKSTLNYTEGRIVQSTGNTPLDHIPPLNATLAIQYQSKNLGIEFSSQFNSWKRIDDYYLNGEDNEQYATPEGMPAWWIWNIKISYQLNSYLRLQAGVENIFDTQYRTFASGINGPGRNFYITLRI